MSQIKYLCVSLPYVADLMRPEDRATGLNVCRKGDRLRGAGGGFMTRDPCADRGAPHRVQGIAQGHRGMRNLAVWARCAVFAKFRKSHDGALDLESCKARVPCAAGESRRPARDLPRVVTGASALLETLVVVKLDDLRRRYVQILVDLAGEVLVEQRLELAVLLLQLGDLVDGAAAGRDERVVPG